MTESAAATIGLTGGIASGKSTVSRFFEELGVPVVDADRLAREVVAPGSEGLAAVVSTFGEGVLTPDGTLDRKKLGALVFSDEDARRRLEAITHPRIAAAGAAKIAALQAERSPPYVLYDAALLVESGRHRLFPALVVVAARPETQLARLRARDDVSEDEARRRIDAQMPLDGKLAAASWVIWNDGPLGATRERVVEVDKAIRERFPRTPA